MDGENGAKAFGLRTTENGFDGGRAEVEGGGVDVGEEWCGSGAEDGADGGEEAEGGGENSVAGADVGGGQREPESISTRGAADGVGYAQLDGGGFFKGGDGLAENELAGFEDIAERLEKLAVERLVLAFEVQHGDRLGG